MSDAFEARSTRRQIVRGAAAAAIGLGMPAIVRSEEQSAATALPPLRGSEILPTPNFAQLRSR